MSLDQLTNDEPVSEARQYLLNLHRVAPTMTLEEARATVIGKPWPQLTNDEISAHNGARLDAVEEALRDWSEVLPEDPCDWRCQQGRRVGHVCKANQPSPQAWLICDAAIFAVLVGFVGAAILTASGVL